MATVNDPGHDTDRGQGHQRPRRRVTDPDTHFSIVKSETPVSEDGYKVGEPMKIQCDDCGVGFLLTEEPSPGLDELPHEPGCRYRGTHWDWWWETFGGSR